MISESDKVGIISIKKQTNNYFKEEIIAISKSK
jgi:hypothetical protein